MSEKFWDDVLVVYANPTWDEHFQRDDPGWSFDAFGDTAPVKCDRVRVPEWVLRDGASGRPEFETEGVGLLVRSEHHYRLRILTERRFEKLSRHEGDCWMSWSDVLETARGWFEQDDSFGE